MAKNTWRRRIGRDLSGMSYKRGRKKRKQSDTAQLSVFESHWADSGSLSRLCRMALVIQSRDGGDLKEATAPRYQLLHHVIDSTCPQNCFGWTFRLLFQHVGTAALTFYYVTGFFIAGKILMCNNLSLFASERQWKKMGKVCWNDFKKINSVEQMPQMPLFDKLHMPIQKGKTNKSNFWCWYFCKTKCNQSINQSILVHLWIYFKQDEHWVNIKLSSCAKFVVYGCISKEVKSDSTWVPCSGRGGVPPKDAN